MRSVFTTNRFDAGTVTVDFIPDLHVEDMKSILSRHKHKFVVCLDLISFEKSYLCSQILICLRGNNIMLA